MSIPNIIHRIWLEDPMPEKFEEYGRRWAQLNPDYEVHDWRDPATLPRLNNQSYYARAQNLYPRDWKRFRADIIRLELLWRYGGLYVDTDVEPLQPINPLLGGRKCLVGRSPQNIKGKHPITNAVMAAERHHPYIGALITDLPAAIVSNKGRPLAQSIGPWHLTRVYEGGDWPDVVVLPPELLYEGSWLIHHWNTAARKRGEGE